MKITKTLFLIHCLMFSITSHAFFVESQEENGINYFLYSYPNKIIRYDLSNKQFLPEINLESPPSAFFVNDDNVYIAFSREIKKTNLDFIDYSFIQNTGRSINKLMVIDNYLFAFESYENVINSIELSTLTNTEITAPNLYSQYKYYKSKLNSSYFLANPNVGLSIINIALDGLISNTVEANSPEISFSSKIFINPDETSFISTTGDIYNIENLNITGFISQDIKDISYLSSESYIALFENSLHLYNANNISIAQIKLANTPKQITNFGNNIFTFDIDDDDVSVKIIALSSFTTPSISTEAAESNPFYNSDLTYFDGENIVYLIDNKNLKMYRWLVSEKKYIDSILLFRTPASINYSTNQKRLYLGYHDGTITYIDLINNQLTETYFNRVKYSTLDLKTIDNFISVYNETHIHSFNADGNLISKLAYSLSQKPKVQLNTNPDTLYTKGFTNNYNSSIKIDLNTGEILSVDRGIYNSSDNSTNLFALNNTLVNSNGFILEPSDFSVLNYLSNSISDAVEIDNVLYSVNAEDHSIQQWNNNFELIAKFKNSQFLYPKLFAINNNLFIVNENATPPSFTLYNSSNPIDSDGDNIEDIWDNCINISNSDQLNTDNDEFGDLCDSDSDNDGLPNSYEVSENFDALNSKDAFLDYDLDGFINIIEYKLNSNLNNINDIPSVDFTSFFDEDFSNGIPDNYLFPLAKPWYISSNSDTHTLTSGNISKQTSSFSFFNFFKDGILNFKARSVNNGLNSVIIIDGRSNTFYTTNNWNSFSYTLEKGFHTVEISINKSDYSYSSDFVRLEIDSFLFEQDSDDDNIADSLDNCPSIKNHDQSDNDDDEIGDVCDLVPNGKDTDTDGYGDNIDNCPYAYNPLQEDIDKDGLGNSCDFFDNRPLDTDSDGVMDDNDNCINVINKNQSNYDNDQFGDLCDDDIDNDGISNLIEDSYTFLNAYFATDVQSDFDGDGASNYYEIKAGYAPDSADSYDVIDMLAYNPLIEREYLYANETSYVQFSIKNASQENDYIIQNQPYSNVTTLIRKTKNGIYLIESIDSNNKKTIYDNALLMPSKMIIGDTLRYRSKARVLGFSNNSSTSYKDNSITLKSIGSHNWKGKSYDSITTEDESGNETIYLKGIGQLNFIEGLPLISINEIDRSTFERTDDALNSNDSGSETGITSTKELLIIFMLLLYSNLLSGFKKKTHNSI